MVESVPFCQSHVTTLKDILDRNRNEIPNTIAKAHIAAFAYSEGGICSFVEQEP